MTRKLALVAFAGLSLASAAHGQVNSFVLNDGAFRYTTGSLNGGAAFRTAVGGGNVTNFGTIGTNTSAGNTNVVNDYLWNNSFYYRSAGDTREYNLSNMTFSTALGGNSIFTRYVEPIGNNATANGTLTFELTYTLNQITATSAAVTINWSITNNSQASQSVNFFSYSDSDIATAGSDFGTYNSVPGANFYRNDDVSPTNGNFFTMGADLRLNDLWNITPYSTTGTTSALALLGNTAVNDLTNVDVASGAADNLGAFQWQNMVIDAGSSVGGRITLGYNYAIPTPGAAALLGLGALAAGRRRR